jgi:hypothetical protein
MQHLKQWFLTWPVLHPRGCWDNQVGHYEARGWQGALQVGPSQCVILIFTTLVTLDETLANWYYFIKPIHSMVSYFTVIIFLSELYTPLF